MHRATLIKFIGRRPVYRAADFFAADTGPAAPRGPLLAPEDRRRLLAGWPKPAVRLWSGPQGG